MASTIEGTGLKRSRPCGFFLLCCLAWSLLGTGCVPEVYKQSVPVSTNPMGAKVYVDGKPAGETPTAVIFRKSIVYGVFLARRRAQELGGIQFILRSIRK
jgi:hypothetical protein